MDIRQIMFPFIMAVITNSIMIVIIYFLRKIPLFANLFSVSFMVILYLFCLLRIFVPIEIPAVQIIIEDDSIYTSLMESLVVHNAEHTAASPSIAAYVIIGIWIAGTVILSIRSLVKQIGFKNYHMANGDYTTDEERAVLSDIAREVLGSDKNVSLRKTDSVTGTIVVGLIHQFILIPDEVYDEKELRMILRHECMHIKDKDMWIKLLVQIYCCVFWWNPFSYLLKVDLDSSLEMRCDLNAVKNLSDADRLKYAETLINRSNTEKPQKTPFVVSAGFVDGKEKSKLIERIKNLMTDPPQKSKRVAANTLTALVLLFIFVGSYIFIWQPNFREEGPSEESYELEGDNSRIIDDQNAYLLKNNDGTYTFYFDNEPIEVIPKEEVEMGLYEDYPIYEK